MSVGSQLRVSRHTCKRCRFLSCWFAFGVRNACIVSFEAVQTGINLSSSCPHQSALTIRKKTSLLPCQRIRLVWRAPTAQLASAHHTDSSGRVASSPRPPPEPACSSFRAESACAEHLASTAAQARTGGGDLLLAESTEAGAPPRGLPAARGTATGPGKSAVTINFA